MSLAQASPRLQPPVAAADTGLAQIGNRADAMAMQASGGSSRLIGESPFIWLQGHVVYMEWRTLRRISPKGKRAIRRLIDCWVLRP